MENIYLREARNDVDKKYVGFTPNGSSVKPVHIAWGALRCIYGRYSKSKSIKHMALVSDTKGRIPKGNDIESIYNALIEKDLLEEGIDKKNLESMRNIMFKLLSLDKGVYVVKDLSDNMISYSAGSKYFLTNKSLYEDAGEFIGNVIKGYCPRLSEYIKELLDKARDPITILFRPVLEDDMELYTSKNDYEDIPGFKNMGKNMERFIQGLKQSGECLLDNLCHHPNPLTQLRLFNFFCIFYLIRYMTMLEGIYCGGAIRPILLDCSGKSPIKSSVARASEMSYTQMHKSINRFYAWGYSEWLKNRGITIEELKGSETPVYEKGKKLAKATKEELDTLWDMAKQRALEMNDEEAYLCFGETMYDMLAIEGSSHPVTYLRVLGNSSGILYPPDKLHPNKRFLVSQDIMEMLLRCCVKAKEIISGAEIRERMWERFGIVIGGSQEELRNLLATGMILQVDEDALEDNFASFAVMLESMDFAEVMADGILQVRLGGYKNEE